MANNEIIEATEYLQKIPRIFIVDEAEEHKGDVFLLPNAVKFKVRKDSSIETVGLGDDLDKKFRDLISVIRIENALDIKYCKTNILTPLIYAESLPDILWHLNTQGILFARVTSDTIAWIKNMIHLYPYGNHDMDKFWLPCSKCIDEIKPGDKICIFNRRVGGWDGSLERPVIELLGAGGHVPMIWNSERKRFISLSIKENLIKELHEELGLLIDENSIEIFGGYRNDVTHELVVLSGIEIQESFLQYIQDYAYKNIDEDTKGIYLGTFEEVIDYYRANPKPFAGGAKAAPCNFPNQEELMKRVIKYIA